MARVFAALIAGFVFITSQAFAFAPPVLVVHPSDISSEVHSVGTFKNHFTQANQVTLFVKGEQVARFCQNVPNKSALVACQGRLHALVKEALRQEVMVVIDPQQLDAFPRLSNESTRR